MARLLQSRPSGKCSRPASVETPTMTKRHVRQDTNYRVTAEQIGRLERALLAMRESAVGSPDVLDAIALVQYQEILRLRSELDAAMGFAEETSDLVVSLQGPRVGLGAAPVSVIAKTLYNVRGAVQTVSSYLTTGQWVSRGRFSEVVSRSTDFQFVGTASGSVRIRLNLPESTSLFSGDEREVVERSVGLILQTVEWVSSGDHIDMLEQSIDDERLMRLLLTQIRRVTPTRNGTVDRTEFSGRLASTEGRYILSRRSASRIRDALSKASVRSARVTEEGELRSVDVDSGIFDLRQRPDGKPDLTCHFPRDILPQAIDFLVGGATVVVEGVQKFNKRGDPARLIAEDVYELDRFI